MCKSISIFIIQCPPKIMYICIYIYTHDMSLGIFRISAPNKKPWGLVLQSWKKSSLSGLWPATFEGHQHWCLGKSTKMVGKSINDNQKGGSPRILKTGWTFVEKNIPVYMRWSYWFLIMEADDLIQISCSNNPFFDLGKLVTFPNRPRFFWSLTSQNLWDVGESSPVQQRSGKLRYWCQDYAQLFGLGARVSWAKTREKFTSKMVLVLSVCSSETWDNNLQLKQKSPFSWTTSLSFILGPMIWQEDLLERWISILKIFVALSKLCMCLPYTNVPSCPHWRDIRALEFLHEHQDIPSV